MSTLPAAAPADQRDASPRLWVLIGRKAGDNTQLRALAAELGWPAEEKEILAQPWELLAHVAGGVTLAGIDRQASSALEPPWPDLVLTAGRRNEPVARWIQQASGGHTRLVLLGRPWAALSAYDLIITTAQYELPALPHILHNRLPLCRLAAAGLSQAAADLPPKLAQLPRPHIAVLLGGDSGKFVFTEAKARRLGALANTLAIASGGALLVTDSPRTPAAAAVALRAQMTAPHFSHRWGDGSANPYQGLLATADAFVVTGESMSMLAEAHSRRRPLYIFDLEDTDRRWWRLPHAWRYKPLSHRLAMRFGPERMRRDIGRIQAALVAEPQVQWLTEETAGAGMPNEPNAASDTAPVNEELARSADAVRELF